MSTVVHGVITSPPVRSVLYTAKLIDRPAELRVMDMKGGEHLRPEFLKLNPLHTVPTINDEGYILFESNAIVTYLVDRYSKSDSLYPKDLKIRGIVNQRLFLNNVLFLRVRDRVAPLLPGGDGVLRPETLTTLTGLLDGLDALIGGNQWVAGTDAPTVADICIMCTMDALEILVPNEVASRANLSAWLKRAHSWAEGAIDTYKSSTEEARNMIIQMFGAGLGIK